MKITSSCFWFALTLGSPQEISQRDDTSQLDGNKSQKPATKVKQSLKPAGKKAVPHYEQALKYKLIKVAHALQSRRES